MKKIILIAIAFLGLQAMAQEPKKEGRKHHSKMIKDLSAEQIATLKTKKMVLFLDLNETQQGKIQAINLENATKRKAMMAEHKAKKENGTAEKPTNEERYAMAISKLDHKIAMKAKMKDILNKEQYTKWERAQMQIAKNENRKRHGSNKGSKQKS
ncbi:hypothetical protein [Algibacter mikhailovii]|uniref:DUF4890 domain-containing protein n=1 Tax=Algibacter mikhailovii TaxID=425498 RepID=A0A918VE71_9FLAO|nr:hypothetical protein [Algibacter mikhailovii]GGZ91513.1 hypothetical protein GCM10007028_32340 [Algibacter mikhailovii]